jgi:peroxiredoxin
MMRVQHWVGFSLAVSMGMGLTLPESALAAEIQLSVPDFRLPDALGKHYTLSKQSTYKGVVLAFTGLGCPLSNLYTPRLESIAKSYRPKGFAFFAVNSNAKDEIADLAEMVKDFNMTLPLLKDTDHKIADALGVQRTNEVFLIDSNRTVRYHGAIDDQYGIGYQRGRAEHTYLIDALEQTLAGEDIAVKTSTAMGCLINRRLKPADDANVTYHQQVERIIQQNCQACHRAGQIGPFALMTFDDAKGHAQMIKEVVTDRRMPPWHANPEYGHFANDRSLAQEEIDTIVKWVDTGAPKGNPADAPPAVVFKDEWLIGEPDAVVEMPQPFDVPAEGVVDYQYFPTFTNFGEDKWVVAAEFKPGEPGVVHHVLTAVLTPKQAGGLIGGLGGENKNKRRRGGGDDDLSIEESVFVGNVPGQLPWTYPEGTGKFLPKGAIVLFQMHYTPDGRARRDRTKLGLIFAKEKPKYEVKTSAVQTSRIRIPPGKKDHRIGAKYRASKDLKILAFLPHMHLRGTSFRYSVTFPDGRQERLLDVPRYDFGWQIRYVLAEPLIVPKRSELFAMGTYDNSPDNPWNPDPTQEVRFGDQTDEEMMFGFFDYIELDDEAEADRQASAKADVPGRG